MTDLLTRYDLEKFKWKPHGSVGSPNGCVRRLGGGEQIHDIWHRHFKGLHTIFFGLVVDLHDPVSITKLTPSAQECWCSLRFQFPTIASSIGGSDELPTLTYTAETPQAIAHWAERTLLVHSPSHIDLEQLRVDESQKKVPSPDGDYCWMHLVPGELANDGTVSTFGLLLHTHHSLFDGSAVKIIINFFLTQLAKALSGSRSMSESVQWGNELENLPPAVFNILNTSEVLPIPPDSTEEPSFDNEYYKCMRSALAGLEAMNKVTIIFPSAIDTHGFKDRPKNMEWPKTRRAEVLFTREESARILAEAKTSGFTLTHVAHAALAMVVVADNPPNSESASHYLSNFCIVNSRDRLTSNWSLYPGYAIRGASIRIPNSAFLSLDGIMLPLDKEVLLKVAKIANSQYRAYMELPSGLGHDAQLGEICASAIVQSGYNTKLPGDRCYSFVSDGKGERYLNPTFMADTGETVLSVEKFFLSVNTYDADPIFRVSSWAGIIDIGADYNTNIVKADDMMNYLNQWKTFMLLILFD
ncbi:hypothetical protein K503DRAFT_855076 [Rhizopogon vinicolor AM-OR11-026]|uniref:CoA-dependent acyltransferase n=1 Tax=Rhizopogon vinicolor AM-OR11-026 TaxID=1314800 RepID=A0A1B7N7M2_9AGAM|nr:hypothetical protein K503DRAFT_855076 [Rhizopogon vinicolor AM-OR11-026]